MVYLGIEGLVEPLVDVEQLAGQLDHAEMVRGVLIKKLRLVKSRQRLQK